jgi:hypothetical protein
VSERFAGDPRVRVIGFTNRMGDVLAAANLLIHSSAGLTVLEAIIRGCPVISYGFGYGHVRVSNHALERFKLAHVARSEAELRPAIERALAENPMPDTTFAKRPSTAALILGSTRRTRPLPAWRVRAVRTVTAATASAIFGVGAFTSGIAYAAISFIVPATAPLTSVPTSYSQVGVMIDASAAQAPRLARELCGSGMQVSFALSSASRSVVDALRDCNDQAVPRLNDSGLISWLHTDPTLRQLERRLGSHHKFLYTSSGPSLAQYFLAKGVGGELVAGKVRISKPSQVPRSLTKGEIVELRVTSLSAARRQLEELERKLLHRNLVAVPVQTLLQDSGVGAPV